MEEVIGRDHHGEGNGDDLGKIAVDALSAGTCQTEKVEFGHANVFSDRVRVCGNARLFLQ